MQTELDSFLIEISALILAFKDEDGSFLVNKILDKTGMKGTGAHPHITALCRLCIYQILTVRTIARSIKSYQQCFWEPRLMDVSSAQSRVTEAGCTCQSLPKGS